MCKILHLAQKQEEYKIFYRVLSNWFVLASTLYVPRQPNSGFHEGKGKESPSQKAKHMLKL